MPSGGTLIINAKPVTMRGLASEEGLNGEFVAMRVADTGTGLRPKCCRASSSRFSPPRRSARAPVLVLSQVYGFARQSGGAAHHHDVGAPRHRGDPVAAADLGGGRKAAAGDGVERSRAAGRTVLVVEDNLEVAAVGRAYLEELGYRVHHAASAQAALELIERDATIDLVFSDILMPGGMNGLELADTVRRRFPRDRGAVDHRIQFECPGRGASRLRSSAEALRSRGAGACPARGSQERRRQQPRCATGTAGAAAGGGLTAIVQSTIGNDQCGPCNVVAVNGSLAALTCAAARAPNHNAGN